jgi:hypothetical protein
MVMQRVDYGTSYGAIYQSDNPNSFMEYRIAIKPMIPTLPFRSF